MVAVMRLYVDAPPPAIFSPLPFVLAHRLRTGPFASGSRRAGMADDTGHAAGGDADRSSPAKVPVCRGGCRSPALAC